MTMTYAAGCECVGRVDRTVRLNRRSGAPPAFLLLGFSSAQDWTQQRCMSWSKLGVLCADLSCPLLVPAPRRSQGSYG